MDQVRSSSSSIGRPQRQAIIPSSSGAPGPEAGAAQPAPGVPPGVVAASGDALTGDALNERLGDLYARIGRGSDEQQMANEFSGLLTSAGPRASGILRAVIRDGVLFSSAGSEQPWKLIETFARAVLANEQVPLVERLTFVREAMPAAPLCIQRLSLLESTFHWLRVQPRAVQDAHAWMLPGFVSKALDLAPLGNYGRSGAFATIGALIRRALTQESHIIHPSVAAGLLVASLDSIRRGKEMEIALGVETKAVHAHGEEMELALGVDTQAVRTAVAAERCSVKWLEFFPGGARAGTAAFEAGIADEKRPPREAAEPRFEAGGPLSRGQTVRLGDSTLTIIALQMRGGVSSVEVESRAPVPEFEAVGQNVRCSPCQRGFRYKMTEAWLRAFVEPRRPVHSDAGGRDAGPDGPIAPAAAAAAGGGAGPGGPGAPAAAAHHDDPGGRVRAGRVAVDARARDEKRPPPEGAEPRFEADAPVVAHGGGRHSGASEAQEQEPAQARAQRRMHVLGKIHRRLLRDVPVGEWANLFERLASNAKDSAELLKDLKGFRENVFHLLRPVEMEQIARYLMTSDTIPRELRADVASDARKVVTGRDQYWLGVPFIMGVLSGLAEPGRDSARWATNVQQIVEKVFTKLDLDRADLDRLFRSLPAMQDSLGPEVCSAILCAVAKNKPQLERELPFDRRYLIEWFDRPGRPPRDGARWVDLIRALPPVPTVPSEVGGVGGGLPQPAGRSDRKAGGGVQDAKAGPQQLTADHVERLVWDYPSADAPQDYRAVRINRIKAALEQFGFEVTRRGYVMITNAILAMAPTEEERFALFDSMAYGIIRSGDSWKAYALAEAFRGGVAPMVIDWHVRFFLRIGLQREEVQDSVGGSLADAYLRALLAQPWDAAVRARLCDDVIGAVSKAGRPRVVAGIVSAIRASVDESAFVALVSGVDEASWERMRSTDLGDFRDEFRAAYDARAQALAAHAATAGAAAADTKGSVGRSGSDPAHASTGPAGPGPILSAPGGGLYQATVGDFNVKPHSQWTMPSGVTFTVAALRQVRDDVMVTLRSEHPVPEFDRLRYRRGGDGTYQIPGRDLAAFLKPR
jgi:hypothetical protein